MKKVLEGVRVIELSTYAAAPMVGRVLADFGADVIKVEAPSGDPFRNFGLSVNAPVSEEENPCFQLENANKRGIVLNLKSQEGKEILYDLLKDANIFFTNTRIEALRKLGLTYEDLSSRFPHLIYGHISGYGFKGEDSKLPGYDITAFWARGGGLADLATEGNGPLSAPYAVGDHCTTLALCSGLLGALYKQTRTGQGDFVLVSLYGVACFVNSLMITPAQYGDVWPKSKYLPLTPISNTYVCKDGEMITLTILDYQRDWGKFCKVIDREDLIPEERFNNPTSAKQPENSRELVILLGEIFATKNREEWVALLKEYDLPFSITQHLKEIPHDPLAWENGYLSSFTYDSGNTSAIPNTPVQFKENTASPCLRAPLLGEHTRQVLAELGYSPERIQNCIDAKAVCSRS